MRLHPRKDRRSSRASLLRAGDREVLELRRADRSAPLELGRRGRNRLANDRARASLPPSRRLAQCDQPEPHGGVVVVPQLVPAVDHLQEGVLRAFLAAPASRSWAVNTTTTRAYCSRKICSTAARSSSALRLLICRPVAIDHRARKQSQARRSVGREVETLAWIGRLRFQGPTCSLVQCVGPAGIEPATEGR